jgi:hypothetical protein
MAADPAGILPKFYKAYRWSFMGNIWNPQGRMENVDFDVKEGRDATVPEQSAIVEGSEIHPVQQGHGTLYVDRDVKKRLRVELTRP